MYEVVQHTADIRLIVRASSLEELFTDALRGLMEVTDPQQTGTGGISETVEIESVDTTSLLVDFLNEVLTLTHVRRATFSGVAFLELNETSLAATLDGSDVAAFGEDVKAVTFHEAEVRHDGGGWSTNLVLDI